MAEAEGVVTLPQAQDCLDTRELGQAGRKLPGARGSLALPAP